MAVAGMQPGGQRRNVGRDGGKIGGGRHTAAAASTQACIAAAGCN